MSTKPTQESIEYLEPPANHCLYDPISSHLDTNRYLVTYVLLFEAHKKSFIQATVVNPINHPQVYQKMDSKTSLNRLCLWHALYRPSQRLHDLGGAVFGVPSGQCLDRPTGAMELKALDCFIGVASNIRRSLGVLYSIRVD